VRKQQQSEMYLIYDISQGKIAT